MNVINKRPADEPILPQSFFLFSFPPFFFSPTTCSLGFSRPYNGRFKNHTAMYPPSDLPDSTGVALYTLKTPLLSPFLYHFLRKRENIITEYFMAGGGHTVSPPTAAIDVAALPELVDTERMRQDEETLSAAAEEKRRNLVRHEADLQEKRRKLFNDNVAKWPSFVAELDHISQNFARQTVLTARSLLKGTKHEDTVKKAIRQLQQKAMHVTATDSALQSCEKTMGIHATVRLASIDTVPFKVALIASSVRTVADQQTKIEAAAKRLELSLKAAEKYRTRSTSRRSMRSR